MKDEEVDLKEEGFQTFNSDQFTDREMEQSESYSPYRKGKIYRTIEYIKEMRIMRNLVKEIDTGNGSLQIISKINETQNPKKYNQCRIKKYSLFIHNKTFQTISKIARNSINNEGIQLNSNFYNTTMVPDSELNIKTAKFNGPTNKIQQINNRRMKFTTLDFLNSNKLSLSNHHKKIHNHWFKKKSKENNRSSLKNQSHNLHKFIEKYKIRDGRQFKEINSLLKKVSAKRISIRPLLSKIKSFENNTKICRIYNRGEEKEEAKKLLNIKLKNEISHILQKCKNQKRRKY